MKTLSLAALIALSVAPANFAFASSGQLAAVDAAAVHAIVPNADLSNLSAADAAAIVAALYNSDRQSEVGRDIRAILSTPSVEASRASAFDDGGYWPSANSKGLKSQ